MLDFFKKETIGANNVSDDSAADDGSVDTQVTNFQTSRGRFYVKGRTYNPRSVGSFSSSASTQVIFHVKAPMCSYKKYRKGVVTYSSTANVSCNLAFKFPQRTDTVNYTTKSYDSNAAYYKNNGDVNTSEYYLADDSPKPTEA